MFASLRILHLTMQTNAGKSKHILADDDLIKDSQY